MQLFTRRFTTRLIALALLVIAIISIGTIVFTRLEDWTPVQSAYFATATLTTVGYGDFTPTSDASRVVAIVYMLLMVPLFILTIGIVGEAMFYGYNEIHKSTRKSPSRSRKRTGRR